MLVMTLHDDFHSVTSESLSSCLNDSVLINSTTSLRSQTLLQEGAKCCTCRINAEIVRDLFKGRSALNNPFQKILVS